MRTLRLSGSLENRAPGPDYPYVRTVGISHTPPAAVYVVGHQDLGAVKVGACLEPSARRIAQHVRRGWQLLAVFPTPTGWDAASIERRAIKAFTPTVPCEHRGIRRPLRPAGGFLRPEQMPQSGAGETFDVFEVSPARAVLALWYLEADHRARYYPPSLDGSDPEQRHRDQIYAWARTRYIVR